MKSPLPLVSLAAAAMLMAAVSARAENAEPSLPTLAVVSLEDETAGPIEKVSGPSRKDLEDLLVMEIGNQRFLRLVDRQNVAAVMREHAIGLSNLRDAKSAADLGKFAGADYLLLVIVEPKAATVRLVEVASGQVKLKDKVEMTDDLAMFSAAVREKVLAVLSPQSRSTSRLTVGVTEFPNRSGNQLSDQFSVALQKALRKQLEEQTWAVVLERQYPTALLDEADLARTGLVRGKTVENLPPADLVIVGTLEDAGREYEPGKPWEVAVNLTLRMRGHAQSIAKKCRSDAVDEAADELIRQIDDFRRRQPKPDTEVSEKDLWRKQAIYLMPQRCETWNDALVPNFYFCNPLTRLETIRAWENVLLLDPHNTEALTFLGICHIGFNRWKHSPEGAAKCVAGSQIIERAYRSHPTPAMADTYIACLAALKDMCPARAREMAEYVVAHRQQFKNADDYRVKTALTATVSESGEDTDPSHSVWRRAIDNAGRDPAAVLTAFSQRPGGQTPAFDEAAAFLRPYADSPDPMVRFVAQRALGQELYEIHANPASLEHLDKAIEAMDQACSRCGGYGYILNDIYRLRIRASLSFGRPEEARQTAVVGSRRLMDRHQLDSASAWVYHYCVTEALGEGQEKEAIAICDAFLAASVKTYWEGRDQWPGIAARREVLLAKLQGRAIPDMAGWRLVKGTRGEKIMMALAAPMGGRLWLAWGYSRNLGSALLYKPDRDEVIHLADVPHHEVVDVSALGATVFFAANSGLYRLDADGKLLKRYDRNTTTMPGIRALAVCTGGDKVYFGFQGSPHQGVAVLDPAADKIEILAPSNHEATWKTEPQILLSQLRWDPVAERLFAFCYQYPFTRMPMLDFEYHWSSGDKTWHAYPIEQAPRRVVSDGDETLVVRVVGESTEFEFLKASQTVKASLPIGQTVGDPAWDDARIWAPTAGGVYEIDRVTGRVTWLSYHPGTLFHWVLKHEGRLYLATTEGLYYREMVR